MNIKGKIQGKKYELLIIYLSETKEARQIFRWRELYICEVMRGKRTMIRNSSRNKKFNKNMRKMKKYKLIKGFEGSYKVFRFNTINSETKIVLV